MYSTLHCALKLLQKTIRPSALTTKLGQQIAKLATSAAVYDDDDDPKPLPPIVDVCDEDMLYDDDEFDMKHIGSDVPLAPIDVDGWADDEDIKEGTVETAPFAKKPEYPPIPKNRTGVYKFKGIEIIIPQAMLTPATYRYRTTKEEQETLADDIRICKF